MPILDDERDAARRLDPDTKAEQVAIPHENVLIGRLGKFDSVEEPLCDLGLVGGQTGKLPVSRR